MAMNRSATRQLQQLSELFLVDETRYPDAFELLRARLVLGFLLFYAVAWSSYVVLYFSLGNVLSGLSYALFGLPSSLGGLWSLRQRHRPQRAALIANFGGAMVLLGIIASTGAAASPIYAWFFFVTITAFLLNGKKAGYAMAMTTATATGVVILFDMLGYRLPMGFSFDVHSNLYKFFIAYTYACAILFLAVVSHIYDALVVKGLKDVTEARDRARSQFNMVSTLLNNMGQAVFVMGDDGRIKPPVSLFSETIFGRKIDNATVRETLYKDIPRHSEVSSRIETCLALAIGGDSLQWSNVDNLLPAEVEYTLGSTQKTLRCVYRPLINERDEIYGIMCVIEDVTELLRAQKELQKAREENQKNTMILEHIVRIGVESFDGFLRHTANHIEIFHDAIMLVEKDRRIVVDTCLRSIHTIKGNARQIGLCELASEIHDIEHTVVEYLREQNKMDRSPLQVIGGLMQHTKRLVVELKDYDRVLNMFFKAPSAFRNVFHTMLQQGLEHCHEAAIKHQDVHWQFHSSFVVECLRFFEVNELIRDWEQFAKASSRQLAQGQDELWSKSWEDMSRRIWQHEGIRSQSNSRSLSGTLQISTRKVERIRERIHGIENETDEHILRRGLTDLRQLLERLDEVQLDTILKNFLPMIDELSARFDKRVHLLVDTGMTSLQRESVDVLNDALMHIVRNMLDHGLEKPETRRNLGKEPSGTIQVWAREQHGKLEIKISDDGAGIDIERLVTKAKQRGLVPADSQLSHAEAIQLIFLPSLSTKDVETEISGRGFGMEAAKAAVEELGGQIQVESEKERGTTFIISLPVDSNDSDRSLRSVS